MSAPEPSPPSAEPDDRRAASSDADARDAPELDAPESDEPEPDDPSLRRCIATGASLAIERTLRFVVGPDGVVAPDLARRLPGRGIHVAAERAALERAVAKRLFAKAARRAVAVPDDLTARVERLLAERCLEGLGLARRAGQAVAGHDKVADAGARGRLALLIQARDGSPDERRRLHAAARRIAPAALDAEELGRPFDRPRTVHVGVAAGRLAARLETDLGRLAGLRAAGGLLERNRSA